MDSVLDRSTTYSPLSKLVELMGLMAKFGVEAAVAVNDVATTLEKNCRVN